MRPGRHQAGLPPTGSGTHFHKEITNEDSNSTKDQACHLASQFRLTPLHSSSPSISRDRKYLTKMDHVNHEPDSDLIEQENKSIEIQTRFLREHMGLPRAPGGPEPVRQPCLTAHFFVELAPHAIGSGGARCRLPYCDAGIIKPERYRIALSPSMDISNWMAGKAGSAGIVSSESRVSV